MITIGVTGGVGSGKSEILKYLENNYNCRILMSDNAAKELEVPGGAPYEPLLSLLGRDRREGGEEPPLTLENGEIDKQEMARRIFADPLLLSDINALVHPAVNRYIQEEIEREREAGERTFFILESALLIENGYDRILDSMWYIYLICIVFFKCMTEQMLRTTTRSGCSCNLHSKPSHNKRLSASLDKVHALQFPHIVIGNRVKCHL